MANTRRPSAGTFVALAVVVVLAIGCAVTYDRLADRMPDLDRQTLAASGEEGRMARDGLALADFGDSGGYGSVRDFEQVVAMNFLSDKEIAVFREGQATAARATVVSAPEGRIIAIVVKLASPEVARDAAAKLDQVQLDSGMYRVPAPPALYRVELADPAPDGRVHYAHEQLLVRVDLEPAPGVDLGPVFTGLIERQLTELPADA